MGTFTVGNGSSGYMTDMYSRYRQRPKETPCAPSGSQKYYVCEMTSGGIRWHTPLHGNKIRRGEKHMRIDNCVYCAQRIISLHIGETVDDRSFDSWRPVSSVRPSTIIEEDPI